MTISKRGFLKLTSTFRKNNFLAILKMKTIKLPKKATNLAIKFYNPHAKCHLAFMI